MSKSLHLIFNHTLTPKQEADALVSLGVTHFVYLTESLRNIWSHVPSDIESLAEYLQPIKAFVSDQKKPRDYILIQGDFGATYHMVNWAKQNDLIPIYATTKRRSVEEMQEDGTIKKTAIFAHERFRRYE